MAEARVAIVGAGPAGLIAADILSAKGLAVSVYDQRRSPGRKFTLAGRGGLNLTHSEPVEALLDRYGPERRHLESAIRSFDNGDLRSWSASLGDATVVGTSGRVFPESFRATSLLRALIGRLNGRGVDFFFGRRFVDWQSRPHGHRIDFATSADVVSVDVDAVLFGLGGPSWPRVSSDGSWLDVFAAAGVATTPWAPANCGVRVSWSDVMIDRHEGAPLKNVAVSFNGRTVRGDPVITRSGLEGGPIYAHSRELRESLHAGSAQIEIDLFPDLTESQLLERLEHKRRHKDSLSNYLRRKGLDRTKIDVLRDATGNAIDREARSLASLLKAVPIAIDGLSSLDRSISAAGGISFDSLDESFMIASHPGVFVAGEMVDWEAPTGGYLLQATFSMGVWAAESIARYLED